MTDILTRLRDATEDDEYSVLNEAINLAGEKDWISEAQWLQAEKWLNVGAFVDAARTLVPEGCAWSVSGEPLATKYAGEASIEHPRDGWQFAIGSDGRSPAIALCTAALKARMAKENAV